jgi:transglutaminase-like putative cysteine protease
MNGRGVLAIAVLAAWGAGVATFVQRENNRSPRERLAEAAMRVAPGAHYFLVEHAGRHTGFASVTVDTIPEGLQITDYAVRDTGAGAFSGRLVTRVVSHLSRGLWLRDVEVSAGAPGADAAVARVVDDSTLEVIIERGSHRDTARHRFTPPLLIPTLVPLAIALGERPEAGQRHVFDVFDPSLLTVRHLETLVEAESVFVVVDSAVFSDASRRWLGAHSDTVRGWHLVEDGPDGLDVWVDELGREIQSRVAVAAMRRRTAYEVAFENWRAVPRDGSTAALPDESEPPLVASPGALRPHAPIDTLHLVVTGLDLARLAKPSAWQRIAGDTVTAVQASLGQTSSGYWLPNSRSIRNEFARELQVTPWIEVDDPTIAAHARRLRKREGDPVAVAKRLLAWVADSVRLEATLTPPSAAAALRSRAGDVEHHATLFVALARAAGIPSRAVSGILLHDTTFVSHAWAEVWLGQRWVPVDPSLGLLPADGGRVRLAEGGIGARRELDRVVGRATFRVLRVVNAPPKQSSP